MIDDLANKVKKSKPLQRAVATYLLDRDQAYMDSKCRSRLEKRYRWLKASLDGAYSPSNADGYTSNGWLPSLIFPMVREQYYTGRAMTMKNFRQEPLITLEPMYDTPYENAVMAQIALNTNFKRTHFRSKTFERIIDDVWRCGLGVTYSGIVQNTKTSLKTIDTPFGPEQQMVSTGGRTNVVNTRVHPLNYAQDPQVVDPEDSSWKRIIDPLQLSRLISQYKENPDSFIKENIESVIKGSKDEVWEDIDKYKDDETILPDLARHTVDVKNFYAKLWINNNEDDDTDYIIRMVEDKVISIEPNTYDDSMCPIQTYRLRRRPEYFWGNTPAEDVLGHEKFMHIIMNMTAQNAMQALEHYIFYDKNAFDLAAVNNARSNNGFVPIEMKGNLQVQNMIHEYQGRDGSINNIDWVVREMKESVQKSSFKPDFLRSGNKGGVANNTATAATILEETSDVLESDVMEVFGFDVARLGEIDTKQLQMFLGDYVKLPFNPKESPVTIMKRQLLGDFEYHAVSTIHKNRIQETIRLQNVITQMLNYKGSADPSWQNVNMIPVVKKWIQTLDVGDPDNIMPDQPPQQQPPMLPPQQGQNQIPFSPPPPSTPEQVYA